jgi:hypothetical protein
MTRQTRGARADEPLADDKLYTGRFAPSQRRSTRRLYLLSRRACSLWPVACSQERSYSGSAKATRVSETLSGLMYPPPPAAMTTNWRPLRGPR